MNQEKLIRIGSKQSPVFITENIIGDLSRIWRWRIGSHVRTPVLVLADIAVYKIHESLFQSVLSSIPIEILDTCLIDAGESSKQLNQAAAITDRWLKLNITRDTVVICIGGGSLTDLGGFLSSVIKRGLRSIFIPTSLMAMTDASIGGKTALNAGSMKNQIGTFHLPAATIIHPPFLSSLSEREISSGYVEILKHGLIADKDLMNHVLKLNHTLSPPQTSILSQSIRVKIKIVASDPYEKNKRFFLNFGHTFGHAFESHFSQSPSPLSHGHAVALGITEALFLSSKLCGLHQTFILRISEWIQLHYPVTELPDWDQIGHLVAADKKVLSSGVQLVGLEAAQKPRLVSVQLNELKNLHREFISQFNVKQH